MQKQRHALILHCLPASWTCPLGMSKRKQKEIGNNEKKKCYRRHVFLWLRKRAWQCCRCRNNKTFACACACNLMKTTVAHKVGALCARTRASAHVANGNSSLCEVPWGGNWAGPQNHWCSKCGARWPNQNITFLCFLVSHIVTESHMKKLYYDSTYCYGNYLFILR